MMSALTRSSPDHSQRNKSLDYLRGLMATSIMVYHYSYWNDVHVDAGTVLGRLGIYGVSIFYVLSGLTLYIVYRNSITTDFRSILSFFVKRIFRIFPLLWLTITATIFIYNNGHVGWKICLLNYSGLFGFIYIGSSLAVGQWSIGNELVFYVFFPLFLILSKRWPRMFILLVALSIIAGVYFAYGVLNTRSDLAYQWTRYINPFNQLCFFAGGILIGYTGQWVNGEKYRNLLLGLLAACILAFAFYPATGDSINIVTGAGRVFFLFISCLICFCFYHQKKTLPGIADGLFTFLGEASYSIYLLHPLVLPLMSRLNVKFIGMSALAVALLSGLVTVVVSYFVYKKLELPFIRYGKKLVASFGGDRIKRNEKEKEQVVF